MCRRLHCTLLLTFLVSVYFSPWASAVGPMEFVDAVVVVPADLSPVEQQAVTLLREEAQARTQHRWPVSNEWPADDTPVIAVGPASSLTSVAGAYAARARLHDGDRPAEGYRIQTITDRAAPAVLVLGSDPRGVLFGVGRLLRALRMEPGSARLAEALDIETAPAYRIRGHQIGYRPKVNTYDAWTPDVFEQYVRDLVVFGTNAVELIPPRSDDDDDSPHFRLSKMDMMVEMSRILAGYGLDVWIWYPAMDDDYTDPAVVEFALEEWGEVLRRLPRVDAVFVPGGDPGLTRPKVLMALLAKQAENLRRHHAEAEMWMSPQNFDEAWLDELMQILATEPEWLTGVVFGPWVRLPVDELRARVPERYPIRLYPDITHSIHSEYPVPGWDLAYALTEAREGINPRPVDQTAIFRLTAPSSAGFITYSEGVNDDVNKIVWTSLGWNPDTDIAEVLRHYARYFIGPHHEGSFAQGLLALERNWRGPLLANAAVDTTLLQFQQMEHAATPQMLSNWRFQQVLYRAYYDGYIRARLIYETTLEQQARARLREAPTVGSSRAIEQATRTLDRAITAPVATDLRSRIFELAEALYQSIGMQLSVDKYGAIAVSRGANLDTVDFPLNNRVYLTRGLQALCRQKDERQRLAGIQALLDRANPGPGGFYDDLGKPMLQPHLVDEGPGYDKDPGGYQSVQMGWLAFSGGLIGRSSAEATDPDGPASFLQMPAAWWDYAQTRYETPLTMRYRALDPQARYKVRVVYVARSRRPEPKIKLEANGTIEIHPYIARPMPMRPVEFDIPEEATRRGELVLRWLTEPRQGGFNSSVRIAEVFLLRR